MEVNKPNSVISPSKEMIAVYEEGQMKIYIRQDAVEAVVGKMSEKFSKQEPKIEKPIQYLVSDNSDAFREWLDKKKVMGVSWTGGGSFTGISLEGNIDIFKLGYEWALYKQENMKPKIDGLPETDIPVFASAPLVRSIMSATGIKHNGNFYNHPRTNSHASIFPVLKELAEWKPSEVTEKDIAYQIAKDLAAWSRRHPRGGVYSMHRQPAMDGELIDLEERAKKLFTENSNGDVR